MKTYRYLVLTAVVGVAIALIFSVLGMQSAPTHLPLQLILVTLGVGIMFISISSIFELWLRDKASHIHEQARIICVFVTGCLGLLLVIVLTGKLDTKVVVHPWWIVINVSVGLLFISCGFLVAILHRRAIRLKAEPLTELLASFKIVMESELQTDLGKLEYLRKKILEVFESQKNRIAEFEKQYDELSELEKKVMFMVDKRERRQAKRELVLQFIFLPLGAIVGVAFTLLFTRLIYPT